MEVEAWIMWLVIAGAAAVIEIFTTGFFVMWFSVGAGAACVAALLGFNPAVQWGIFVVVSGVLILFSRQFAEKITKPQPPGIGADRYINKVGIVLEKIDNNKNVGLVRIGKDEWRADSDTGDVIPAGKTVKVVRISGAHLVVKIKEEVE